MGIALTRLSGSKYAGVPSGNVRKGWSIASVPCSPDKTGLPTSADFLPEAEEPNVAAETDVRSMYSFSLRSVNAQHAGRRKSATPRRPSRRRGHRLPGVCPVCVPMFSATQSPFGAHRRKTPNKHKKNVFVCRTLVLPEGIKLSTFPCNFWKMCASAKFRSRKFDFYGVVMRS
jgi:hypothetical protein